MGYPPTRRTAMFKRAVGKSVCSIMQSVGETTITTLPMLRQHKHSYSLKLARMEQWAHWHQGKKKIKIKDTHTYIAYFLWLPGHFSITSKET